MFSALVSFLGGGAFRSIWGEVSHWLTARQEHRFELERMKMQGDLDAATHARNLEAIRVQGELGVKTIEVQRDADLSRADADAFSAAVAAVGKPIGIGWIDAWNGAIRPLLATAAFAMVVFEIIALSFVMGDWHRELIGAILGIYVADRSLAKRGK